MRMDSGRTSTSSGRGAVICECAQGENLCEEAGRLGDALLDEEASVVLDQLDVTDRACRTGPSCPVL